MRPTLSRPGPEARLRLEFTGIGLVVSLLSMFLGFYMAAYVLADRCYPQLDAETIAAAHRDLFVRLPALAGLYAAMVSVLYWFYSASQLRRGRSLRGGH